MKHLKKYTLLFFTSVFILLGAALPYLTSQMQNAQISGLQKNLELSTVNLTLRQEGDVGPVLQLISKEHTESPWEGETVLSKGDACRAAMTVAEAMARYDLLPEGGLERLSQAAADAQPQLLVGEDGSSALIWACTWDNAPGTYITLDDATGEAVRILTGSTGESASAEDVHIPLEQWRAFFQDYYQAELEMNYEVELTEAGGDGLPALSHKIYFSSKDGTSPYSLNLELENGYVFFNYL